ncbi:GL16347 [Drosophila persimilis]|uniref:GL16347 n=1 Tax=Drosophila persimilis TaxID=7234 RepID=B4IRS5_DROPE|nr:GL16347 [Drosophila persimilis]
MCGSGKSGTERGPMLKPKTNKRGGGGAESEVEVEAPASPRRRLRSRNFPCDLQAQNFHQKPKSKQKEPRTTLREKQTQDTERKADPRH